MSNLYEQEGFSGENALDLRGIPGTNCYCCAEAFGAIDSLVAGAAERVRWIDSGDYHYLSLFFMRQIREPFELLLIDNHPDDQAGAFDEDILSCGNWVREARRLPLLKADTWIDGDCRVHRGSGDELLTDGRVADGELAACDESGSCCVADGNLTLNDSKLPIYISLDLDVLDREYFRTDWSQGSMTPGQLEGILRGLTGRKILGIDICGGLTVEKGATPSDLRTNLLLRHRLSDFLSAF